MWFSQRPYRVGTTNMPILQIKKLKLREPKQLSQISHRLFREGTLELRLPGSRAHPLHHYPTVSVPL